MNSSPRRWHAATALAVLLAAASPGCKHDAQVHGSLTQMGKGVPGAKVTLDCPDGNRPTTTTNATGNFRFEELGPGVNDECTVGVDSPGSWIGARRVGDRCGQHDPASGLCTEAIFAFETR